MLTRAEMGELCLIPLVASGVAWLAGALPERVGVGQLMLYAFGLLMLQSLLRDLWLLRAARARARTEPRREAACMCLESTVGVIGLLLGAVLLLAGVSGSVAMTPTYWGLGALAVLTACFLGKDLVVGWRPLSLRRDPDHMNVVVRWR